MNSIHKYPLSLIAAEEIRMPWHAKVIHTGLDPEGVPCIWAEVNTKNKLETVTFLCVGTDRPMPEESCFHIGSIVTPLFVWHLYQKT